MRASSREAQLNVIWRLARGVRNSRLVTGTMASLPWGGGIILRYHSVNDDPNWSGNYLQPSLVVHPDAFERQVVYLKHHYQVVPIGEIADSLLSGRSLNPRTVAITFDDGYVDNYQHAFRILKQHGVPGAFYITTGAVGDKTMLWTVRLRAVIRRTERKQISSRFLGDRTIDISTESNRDNVIKWLTGLVKRCGKNEADDLLAEIFDECGVDLSADEMRVMANWDELREMHSAGMTIGAHTISHYNLTTLTDKEAEAEIAGSRDHLERELGDRIEHFAYPNGRTSGHCDARIARVIAGVGLRSAVTSATGPVSLRYSVYGIPRLGVAIRHEDVRLMEAHMQYARLGRAKEESILSIAEARPEGRERTA